MPFTTWSRRKLARAQARRCVSLLLEVRDDCHDVSSRRTRRSGAGGSRCCTQALGPQAPSRARADRLGLCDCPWMLHRRRRPSRSFRSESLSQSHEDTARMGGTSAQASERTLEQARSLDDVVERKEDQVPRERTSGRVRQHRPCLCQISDVMLYNTLDSAAGDTHAPLYPKSTSVTTTKT